MIIYARVQIISHDILLHYYIRQDANHEAPAEANIGKILVSYKLANEHIYLVIMEVVQNVKKLL